MDINNSTHNRPSDEISPEQKQNNPDYSLAWSEFIHYQHTKDRTEITSNMRARFAINRSYARGSQSNEIYKKALLDDSTSTDSPTFQSTDVDGKLVSNSRKGYINVDFDNILSPLPKILQAIVGIMESQEHNIIPMAIDEASLSLKEQAKYEALTKGMLFEDLQQLNRLMGVDFAEQQMLPRNIQELQLQESLGAFKLKYEIGLQKVLSNVFNSAEFKRIKPQFIKDLATLGYAAVTDYYDYNTRDVKAKHVDPSTLIIEKSESPYFENASYFAFYDNITLFQVKAETSLSDEDLYALAESNAGLYGNSMTVDYTVDSFGYYNYMQFKVRVLRAQWKTNDYEYRTKRITTNGEEIDKIEPYRKSGKPKVYDKGNKKTYRISTKTLYHATWIVGSEIVYDFGRVHGINYDYKKKDVPLGIHVFRLDEIPVMESCIPVEDQIELTFLRLQNNIAQAPPPGLAIEYNSLMGMTIEDSEWTPLDSLRLKSHTGNILFSVNPNGIDLPPNYPDPIRELKGGMGTSLSDAISSFQLAYNNLRVITGIDDIVMATNSINAQQGKAVSEMAMASTINTLKPIYSGYLSVKEDLALSLALRIQALIVTNTSTPYDNIIGQSAIAALKAVGNKSPVQLGIHLVAAPDEALKQEVRAAAQAALAGGKDGHPALKYSEYLFIIDNLISSGGIASARMYIAMKESQNEQLVAQRAQEAIKAQSEENQKLNEQKAKDDDIKMNKEATLKINEINAKKDADIDLEVKKHENKMEEIRLEKELSNPSV